jgi:hypothetical protein
MKHAERFTKITLTILAIFSLVAVLLQIVNEKTDPLETVYEIITFSVAVIALMLTVTQGIYNARVTKELKTIISEVHQLMNEEETDLKADARLERKIDRDIAMDKEQVKLLQKK